MATKVKFSRVDLAANFTSADPVLSLGEIAWEQDTKRAKVGDGVTAWTSLAYSFECITNHSGLVLDDGTNPHGTTKSDVGLGNVDNTSDANKPVSTATQTALDLKYDASNPNGYETPAQLNARDTANRARANHTGTQPAGTITGLATVATSGDHTDLSNIGTNTHAQIDSHIANTSNPHSTTITQAISADAGTDITTAELEELTDGSVTTLHDHPFRYYDYAEKVSDASGSIGINDTTTLTTWLALNTAALVAGTYKITVSYTWSLNDGAQDFIGEVRLDGSTIKEHVQEPKDISGTGVVLSQVGGGTTNSGTSQRHSYCTSFTRVLTAGTHDIDIRWAGSATTDKATIYDGEISIERMA